MVMAERLVVCLFDARSRRKMSTSLLYRAATTSTQNTNEAKLLSKWNNIVVRKQIR
jgi:hypothetical protein